MSLNALIIASLSLVISGLALGWQVAAWLLNGARVKVALKSGIVGAGGAVSAAVPRSGRIVDMTSMRQQGWSGPAVLGIEVTNIGRSRAKIVRFSAVPTKGGLSLVFHDGGLASPQLPHWLEPGESETWYGDMQNVVALVNASQVVSPNVSNVWMSVELGTGKVIKTRHSARVI